MAGYRTGTQSKRGTSERRRHVSILLCALLLPFLAQAVHAETESEAPPQSEPAPDEDDEVLTCEGGWRFPLHETRRDPGPARLTRMLEIQEDIVLSGRAFAFCRLVMTSTTSISESSLAQGACEGLLSASQGIQHISEKLFDRKSRTQSTQACLALVFLSACALSACVLGDEATAISPYESATFESTQASAVGDGLTPVSVLVHGDFGATLTLQVSDAQFYGSSAEGSHTEKTVQLQDLDDEGNGLAEVQLVSSTPGLALLSFKLAPLAATLEIEFVPVEVVIGAPHPVELRPGVVVHELCVYANTSRGLIQSTASSGSILPRRSELARVSKDVCGVDSEAWAGSAQIQWSSVAGETQVEIDYFGSEEQALLELSLQLDGEVFPGYQGILHEVEVTNEWAHVRTQLAYQATGTLESKLAVAVPLHDIRSVPAGLKLLGSSSGSESAIPETDSQGRVTLYFEVPEGSPALSVFTTPLGGGTLYLGEVPAH